MRTNFVSVDKTGFGGKMTLTTLPVTKNTVGQNMFGKMFEINSLVKQAREFGGRMQEMNDKLKDLRAEGSAGGGLVTISVNGLQEIVACKIDPCLFQQGDVELLEDLIVTAENDAADEARSQQAETMRSLAGDVDMSGLTNILEKLVK